MWNGSAVGVFATAFGGKQQKRKPQACGDLKEYAKRMGLPYYKGAIRVASN